MNQTPTTVPQLFLQRVQLSPKDVAYQSPEGGGWRDWTWEQISVRVRHIAMGLRSLGLKHEERVAIASNTRLEWVLADLGAMCAGGAVSTIYPSSTAEDTAYIVTDSQSVFVFAENQEQVAKLQSRRKELGVVRKVIVFDDSKDGNDWVMSLADLEALGMAADEKDPTQFEKHANDVKKEALGVLIYTSGTTGRPKGVELLQDGWVAVSEGIAKLGLLKREDVQYLWLPLSHVFGKVLEVAQLRIGFRTAIDGRVDKLVENLGQVRPTFVAAVPRIFEKVHNRVVGTARQAGGAKWAIFQWAFKVGGQVSKLQREGKSPGPVLMLQHAIADKLVFSKLKNRFGGRLRFFISGSAPLSMDLAEFFHSAGIMIAEGYGLTETSAATCVNRPDKFRFGTVGAPFPGTEVMIAPSDGEVLIRGRPVMRGYHNLPQATAEALDKDGWLHTGDIGEYKDGFLRITDRKKDLIKTSGGKYVAPTALEGKFKALCPYISQIVVHGNNRNFCTALIALDEESIRGWGQSKNLPTMSYGDWVKHDQVKSLIGEYVTQLNSELANYESIRKWAILPVDLTLEAGDLTPSMKVKRKVVEEKYKSVLDGFYSGAVERM